MIEKYQNVALNVFRLHFFCFGSFVMLVFKVIFKWWWTRGNIIIICYYFYFLCLNIINVFCKSSVIIPNINVVVQFIFMTESEIFSN